MKMTYEEIGTQLDVIEGKLAYFTGDPKERKQLEENWKVLYQASKEIWRETLLVEGDKSIRDPATLKMEKM